MSEAPFRPSLGSVWPLPPAFGVGWQVYEQCPPEHEGDDDRRGGIVVGWSNTLTSGEGVVVLRYRYSSGKPVLRQQLIPVASLDPTRILEPDRRACRDAVRVMCKAIGAGKGDLSLEDLMWLGVARQLAEAR